MMFLIYVTIIGGKTLGFQISVKTGFRQGFILKSGRIKRAHVKQWNVLPMLV